MLPTRSGLLREPKAARIRTENRKGRFPVFRRKHYTVVEGAFPFRFQPEPSLLFAPCTARSRSRPIREPRRSDPGVIPEWFRSIPWSLRLGPLPADKGARYNVRSQARNLTSPNWSFDLAMSFRRPTARPILANTTNGTNAAIRAIKTNDVLALPHNSYVPLYPVDRFFFFFFFFLPRFDILVFWLPSLDRNIIRYYLLDEPVKKNIIW